MILITGTMQLKDGLTDELLSAAKVMCEASRAEPGCHAYRYAVDFEDSMVMTFHEEWEDEAAVATHFATPHMAAFLEAMPAFVGQPPVIVKWVGAEASALG